MDHYKELLFFHLNLISQEEHQNNLFSELTLNTKKVVKLKIKPISISDFQEEIFIILKLKLIWEFSELFQ